MTAFERQRSHLSFNSVSETGAEAFVTVLEVEEEEEVVVDGMVVFEAIGTRYQQSFVLQPWVRFEFDVDELIGS